MLIKNTELTPALARWLREAHDDGAPELHVEQRGADIEVRRADGSEPSATERVEIEARLAAHGVQPLK